MFSPDGKWLLILSDNSLRIWNTVSQSENLSIRGSVFDAQFSPRGSWLAWLDASDNDRKVSLWNMSDSKPGPLINVGKVEGLEFANEHCLIVEDGRVPVFKNGSGLGLSRRKPPLRQASYRICV